MNREFSYAPDRIVSELRVRLFDKKDFLGSILVRFSERNQCCELHSVEFFSARPGYLVGFTIGLEIERAVRAAAAITRQTVTIDQLNGAYVVTELFD